MLRTNIYLDEGQTSRLDGIARQERVSRAEVVRQFIDQALAGRGSSVTSDIEAIQASFGVARDIETLSRGGSDRERHLEGMWAL